ncbi:uncharacterized protein [Coffea arabica]|uniref:Reverse transcriptase domain-containing protein n=1 Tax=Coffea arabica TaxID=13443 RepID=A0ABM4VQC3_COFAR
MPGVMLELAIHRLHVGPNVRPVQQKKRNFTLERNEVVKKEVDKLLEVRIVKEVYYPTWLANPALVEKDDKNAGATYQRLVNRLFINQIDRNMEVYVNDMLIKSRTQEQFITNLREIFNILRRSQMKLNPKKYTFGVRSGKFLGYMIFKNRIRANPDKVKTIMDMAPLKNIKEVQRLAGKMAALNRAICPGACSHNSKTQVIFPGSPHHGSDRSVLEASKPDMSERMVKWAVELSEYDFSFQS